MPRNTSKTVNKKLKVSDEEILEESDEELEEEETEEEEEGEDDTGDESDTKITKKKKKELIEQEMDNEFAKISKFAKVYKEFRQKIEDMTKISREVNIITKKMNKMYYEDIKKARHMKYKNPNRKPTGFNRPREFTNELLDLIGVKHGTMMSMPQFTKKIWKALKDNNLVNKENGRILRVNDAVKKAFKLTNEQVKKMNETTDCNDMEGLNFKTLQKFISNALKSK